MKKNLIKLGVAFILILFFSLVILNYSPMSNYKTTRQTKLTEKKIKEFEEDIEAGKNVDIKDYLEEEKNNSNSISKATFKVSKVLGDTVNKIVLIFFKSIEKTVTE